MFKWTLQQNKQYKKRAYIKYKKQGYYARDYKISQGTNAAKNTSTLRSDKKN